MWYDARVVEIYSDTMTALILVALVLILLELTQKTNFKALLEVLIR
jgi:hypothetical protein